jgi:cardiolipin synthase (CMP-forming)
MQTRPVPAAARRTRASPRRWPDPVPLWREMTGSTPNRLTTLRLAMLPLLWVLALLKLPVALGLLVAFAAATDVLDGYLARSRGLATEFGSRFDSIADHLLTASVVAWLVMLRLDFFREELAPLLVWMALGSAALLVGWIRFGRIGALHLYSAKAAGFLGYCFAIHLLISGSYARPFFHLGLGVSLLAAAETLLVYLTRTRVDEHIGSVLLPPSWGRGDPGAEPSRTSLLRAREARGHRVRAPGP